VSGFIYFIAAETLGTVKIGFSRSDPTKRLRSLQTGCPAPLKLLAYAPGSQQEEASLHEAFVPLHIHGEWFRHELKLRALISYFEPDERGLVSRTDFEQSLHDVIHAAADATWFVEPKPYEREWVGSALTCPLEQFA
jgi:hypothetical protein